jgi:hypothetical protein
MQDLFSSLYKYRERPLKSQKENFTIEVLTYLLLNDFEFAKGFLSLIRVPFSKILKCKSQYFDDQYGKPDIYVELENDHVILIECKIDSFQGNGQINRYLKILHKMNFKNKHLVYLTKYQEYLPENDMLINIKWQNILNIPNSLANPISLEFNKYIISQKMHNNMNFDKSDLNIITEFKVQLDKLEHLRSFIKGEITKLNIGGFKNDKKLHESYVGLNKKIKNGYFWIGYIQYDTDAEIQLSIHFESEKLQKFRKEFIDFLIKLKYKTYEENDAQNFYVKMPLSKFFSNEILNVEKLKKEIHNRLLEIKTLIE